MKERPIIMPVESPERRAERIQRIAAFLGKLDGAKPWELILRPFKRSRTGRQNNALWGVAYKQLSDFTGFTEVELHSYPNDEEARAALRRGEVDLLFGDGISLAFWLNGTDSAGCCVFRGGPFLESRFFGEGIGIAVRRGNDVLRQAFNWALFRLWENGKFTDLWLRYFPISPF